MLTEMLRMLVEGSKAAETESWKQGCGDWVHWVHIEIKHNKERIRQIQNKYSIVWRVCSDLLTKIMVQLQIFTTSDYLQQQKYCFDKRLIRKS